MHLNGEKLLKCHLKRKSCRKWEVGLNINDSEKNWTPGADLPQPRGIIHVYYHNIQTSSPLKRLANQSQISCEASTEWGNQCVYK